MRFLVELGYAKKANDLWDEDYKSVEIRSFPTIFDSPNAPERHQYTY